MQELLIVKKHVRETAHKSGTQAELQQYTPRSSSVICQTTHNKRCEKCHMRSEKIANTTP